MIGIFISGFIMKLILSMILTTEELSSTIEFTNTNSKIQIKDTLSLLKLDQYHFIIGIGFIGILGCFTFFFNIFTSPFLPSLSRRDKPLVLIIIFIVIGVIKSFYMIWKYVKKLSEWYLTIVEDAILDVQPEPEEDQEKDS
jgi:hypothetical protein